VAQVIRFGWHYVQMAIAMELGMFLPVGLVLSALGLSHVVSRSPEASALVMTAEMVLGMAAWMCIRRHPWRHTVEMSAGMAASTVVAAAASLAGLLPHTAVQSGTVGMLMWAGMLGAMLFRWRDYAQGHRCHGAHQKTAA
jgi:flagellar biosynthetic protein FliP